jgi:ribosomal protein L4
MVQGKTKGLQQKSGNNARHAAKAAANTKKGKRAIAPKKTALVKQAALHKVCTMDCTLNDQFCSDNSLLESQR